MLSLRSRALIARAKRVIAECDALLASAGFKPKTAGPTDDELSNPWFLPDPTLPPDQFAAVQQRHKQIVQQRYSPEQRKLISVHMGAAWQRDMDRKPVCIHRLVACGPGNFGLSPRYAAAIRQFAETQNVPPKELSRRLAGE